MFGTIAEPRAIRLNPYTDAFERKLLPNFSEWMIGQIEEWKPDFLIPIETRGVHVLDAALTYAREDLGIEIDTPMLYRSALAYVPRQVLEGSRLLIVEDAINTGASLQDFLKEIHRYGATSTRAIACFGSYRERALDVECYLRAEQKSYMRYLWQLAEIVVARGLPPEVDHTVYELRLPMRLTWAWHELQSLLPRYGQLTVDGPESKRDELQPMTLHFPQFDGPIPSAFASSPNKVRFFPDPVGDRILVLPIAFPALRLPPMAVTDELDLDEAKRTLTDALGAESEIGTTLLERAQLLDPLTIFRAISTAREVATMTSLARVVGEAFSDTTVRARDDVFGRLFGEEVGDELSGMVKRQLDEAVSTSPAAFAIAEAEPELIYLDETVAEATRALAGYLKGPGGLAKGREEATRREAVSVSELIEALSTDDARSPADPLLASRCSTYGLAVSTLVPFIDLKRDDELLMVERKYHVSEPFDPKRDLEVVRREKSAQAIAVICRRLQSRVEHYKEGTPLRVLAGFIALLRPLVLEPREIELQVMPGAEEPLIVLCDMVKLRLIDEPSQFFEIHNDRVRPSKKFLKMYEAHSLDLDIGESTLAIEREVDNMLVDLLDDELSSEDIEALMRLWTLSADHALGLTHVRSSLLAALDGIRAPLAVIARESAHGRQPKVVDHVQIYTSSAHEKLERLKADQGSVPRPWSSAAGRREEQLAQLLGTSTEASPMYCLAGALVELVEAIARIAEFLDAASSAHWDGHASADMTAYGYSGEVGHDTRPSLLASRWSLRAMESLMTVASLRQPLPDVGANEESTLAGAATALLELTEQIAMFTAAIAGAFCCPPHRPAAPEPSSQRETTMLVMDIEGYRAHRREHRKDTEIVKHRNWTMRGIELVAQWARAYGGVERPEFRGDDILMEFEGSADSAALAAASVLSHTSALRSMNIDAFGWRFHNGIDHGYVDFRDNNAMGECIDNAAAFSKLGEAEANDVKLTEKAWEQCSPDLPGRSSSRELGDLPVGKDKKGEEFFVHVLALDGVEMVVALAERLRRVAGETKDAFAEEPPVTRPLKFEAAEPSDEAGELGGDA